MPFIETPALRIHYEQAGSTGDTLVLLHGNFASRRWWQPLLAELPEGYRALAPDLRGCGFSDKPMEGYTLDRLTADLAAFADALAPSRFHLIGHSLGAAVALEFAAAHGGRLRSLVLVTPPPPNGLSPPESRGTEGLVAADSLARWLPSLALNEPLLNQVLYQAFSHPDLHGLVEDALRISPLAAAGFTHVLTDWNIEAALPQIQVPTLIVGGAKDPLISPQALQQLAAALPQAQLVLWPDAGHTPLLEHPQRFRELLWDFLAQW